MLVGRRAAPRTGFALFDAWAFNADGTQGATWSRTNSWAAPSLLPDQRIDYLFTGWPKRGGVGSPLRAKTAELSPHNGIIPSDHYAVIADLRY